MNPYKMKCHQSVGVRVLEKFLHSCMHCAIAARALPALSGTD